MAQFGAHSVGEMGGVDLASIYFMLPSLLPTKYRLSVSA